MIYLSTLFGRRAAGDRVERPQSRDIAVKLPILHSGTALRDRLFDAPAPGRTISSASTFTFPFCSRICPYCDFNTYAGQSARIPAYIDALVRETAQWGLQFSGRSAASIFIGGGTPSLLAPIKSGLSSSAAMPFRFGPRG